jgi:hypothetical protein
MLRSVWDRLVAWVWASVKGGAVDRRPTELTDGERTYITSYVWLRIVVGFVGWLLPALLLAGDATVLAAPLKARDSMSAYYHSPMQDWFVGSLCVIGVLLITYMIGAWKNFEFVISSIAGMTLLGVAFFPTERSNLRPGARPCEASPRPRGCSALEHRLGEVTTGTIHLTFAAIALTLLAVIAFLFAARAKWGGDRESNPRLAWLQLGCGVVIVIALGVAVSEKVFGHWRLWVLTPLYVGEVVTVVAFGLCWIAQGWDLRRWVRQQPKAT